MTGDESWRTQLTAVLEHCREWVARLDSHLGDPRLYLFGSAINRGGFQFDVQKSDLDFVVLLPSPAADATDRTAWLERFRAIVQAFEVSLIPVLHRDSATKPATSFVAVTRQEIQADVHKSHVRTFFRQTVFRDLRPNGNDQRLLVEPVTPIEDYARQVLEYVQGLRNKFLSVTASGHAALVDWEGDDPIPKELMRFAAMTRAHLKGLDQKEFDLQEGLDYLSDNVYSRREASEGFGRLHDWLSVRRGARGHKTPLRREDHLFLAEVLFDLVIGAMTKTLGQRIPGFIQSKESEEVILVRAELIEAGYVADSPFETAIQIGKVSHSTIYRMSSRGEVIIVKLTTRNLADVDAVSLLKGRLIEFEESGVSVQLITPFWVGQSTNNMIEVMPFVKGVSLEKVRWMSPSKFLGDILALIFNGLVRCAHAVHEAGVVHRDITPSNLLISLDGETVRVSLIDLSFACRSDGSKQVPVATGAFSSPEQKQGAARAVSDFYSIAATTCFLANGSAPSNQPEKLARELEHVDLRDFRPRHLDSAFIEDLNLTWAQQCLLALLRANPDERPADYWQLLLGTPSRSAIGGSRVVGLLDFDTFGIAMIDENGRFNAIPAESVPEAAAELLKTRTMEEKVREDLFRMVVRFSKK